MRKVMILTPFFPPNIGGAETFAENLVKKLIRKYKVRICTIKWGRQKLFKGTGIKQFLEVFPRLFPKFFFQLIWNRFDTVYAQGFNSALMGALFKRIFRYKLYVVILALYDFKDKSPFFRYIATKILNQADKIFVEGEFVKQDFLNLDIDEKKIIKYQHWCDPEVYKPVERNYKELTVLCTGRLRLGEKGLYIIKEVERQLKKEDIIFIYAENIPHKDMPKYYQMADVVVIPSVYSEAIPLVVIEAANCGCALIATDRGSLPEVIKDIGSIVKEEDGYARGFKNIILFYDQNRGHLKIVQDRTYEYAKEHFSPKNAEIFWGE